jgi:S1-C subfamily serine protease
VDDISDHLYADPPGSSEVVVSRVFVDGPGRPAGLQVGDIIESFNGRPVSNARELVALKDEVRSGDQVAVGIRRSVGRFNVVIKAQ